MNNKRAFQYLLCGGPATSIGSYWLVRNAAVAAKTFVKEAWYDARLVRAGGADPDQDVTEIDKKFVEITSQLEKR